MSTAAILCTHSELEVAPSPRESAQGVVQRGPAQDWLISSVADVLAQVHKETPLRKDTVAAIKGALNSSGFKALPEDTKITLTAIFHDVTGRLGRAWETVQLTINHLLLEDRTQVAQRVAELQTQAQNLHNCLMGAAHLGDALPHLAAFASAAGPLKQSDLSLHFSADDHTPLVSICLNSGNIVMDNNSSSTTAERHDECDSSTVQQRDEICYRILHVCTLDELYMLLPEVEQMNTMYDMDVDESPTLSSDDSSINSSSMITETPVLAAVEYQTQAHARLSNTLKLGLRLVTHHPVVVASVYQEWLTNSSTSSNHAASTYKAVSVATWQRQEAVYKSMQRSSFSTASQPEVSTDHTVGFNIKLGNSSNNCSSSSTSETCQQQQQQQQQALATRSVINILTAFCD
jgi:hypothetical protein